MVFAQPDIETGEPSPSSNIELVCMEEDEEAILDVPESSENESLNLGEVNESGIFHLITSNTPNKH